MYMLLFSSSVLSYSVALMSPSRMKGVCHYYLRWFASDTAYNMFIHIPSMVKPVLIFSLIGQLLLIFYFTI